MRWLSLQRPVGPRLPLKGSLKGASFEGDMDIGMGVDTDVDSGPLKGV